MTDLVLIEWEDSAQPIPNWSYLADLVKPSIVKCMSVGWLVHDGDDVKALAPNMGEVDREEDLQISGVIKIPASCVTRLVKLSEQS